MAEMQCKNMKNNETELVTSTRAIGARPMARRIAKQIGKN
jgi:hypothetical protein